MKRLLTGAFLLLCTAASAQQVIDVSKTDNRPAQAFYTVNGIAFSNVKYVQLKEGSPFFTDQWMKAVVVSRQGERYSSVPAKLDLLTGELIYLGADGAEFICTLPLKEIVLTDTVSGAVYQFVHSSSVPALAQAERGWYQPLVDGKASLYQFNDKTMQESKPYNSGVTEQRVRTLEVFLLVQNGVATKVRKPRDLILLLPQRKGELESFLGSAAGRAGTTAAQMTALVKYYNSLQ